MRRIKKVFLTLPTLTVLAATCAVFFAGCAEKNDKPVCIPKSEFEKEFLTDGFEVVGILREGPLCGYLVKKGNHLNVMWYRDGVVILGTAFDKKKRNLNVKLIKSLIPPDRLEIKEDKEENR
jgi:hypothetical protein